MKLKIHALQQETEYTCLPACIRMVFSYLGKDISEKKIASACHTTNAGTKLKDAVQAARHFGYEVTQIQDGLLEDLFQSINNFKPVIVILGLEHLSYGDFGTHSVVVTGFKEDHILIIEPLTGKEKQINILDFLKAWQSRGKKGIIIHPGEK